MVYPEPVPVTVGGGVLEVQGMGGAGQRGEAVISAAGFLGATLEDALVLIDED